MGDTFHGVIAFALLATMLLIGSVLRTRISLLRRSLIPSSIIGGVIGFVLLSLDLIPGFSPQDFTALTFHLFTLSFMSLCLTGSSKDKSLSGGSIVRGGLWLTLMWTLSLGLQGVIGLLVAKGYAAVSGQSLSEWLGAIITHGFTQGPGQALTYGGIWEDKYAIANAAQVGLIYASLGFIVAFCVGIPFARYVIKKGLNANQASKIDSHFISGFYTREEAPSSGRLVSHPANVDNLAYHLALLGVAYLITYIWLSAMQPVVEGWQPLGINVSVLFSFNLFFIHGLFVAVVMRMVIDRLGLDHYVDDETLKRITGSSVDLMVVGTVMCIKFAVLSALLVPILLISLVVTLVTAFFCLLLGKMSGPLGYERGITAFGCCCGSTGTGLLLLRMMDANFSTSVPKELAFFNLAIILVNLHILFVFAPIVPSMGMGGYIAVYGGTALVALCCVPLLLRGRSRSTSTQGMETKQA
ncbi:MULTISPECIES: sodium/glutamate symporter [Marinobacterium]|uniref:Glutamate:Na+ symporter, ESS family n=2 Tax=Marinobacterium TaxID=48075 RepID=A0A1H6DHH6_9GAMM|nr:MULTISPECIES: sodium/glutamate symporter [Marinobacterium]TCK03553.1 ESS family glutamate:Na+ symporter [Marinobacterium mangrovicola]SEG84145.1 glutamate:Na+ symporter, ESS family [Marinobacterium lutimaris]